ncbi:MAG: sarcosine oxidase subunit gamma [Pseudorhodobacter sp.]
MADLIAKSPLGGLSVTIGTLTLAEVDAGPITSVAPFRGQAKALDKALKPLGLAFPAPNRLRAGKGARLVWTSRDQAFLIGADAAILAPHAALTDQTDGWAMLRLSGQGAADALMRLVPLDLDAMLSGEAARAPLGHMQSILMREESGFEILVFRSMARTAWHEIETAMKSLAARAVRPC